MMTMTPSVCTESLIHKFCSIKFFHQVSVYELDSVIESDSRSSIHRTLLVFQFCFILKMLDNFESLDFLDQI